MATLDADARTSAVLITDIIETDLPEGQINAFANTAHRMVNLHLASSGLSATILTEIETWLAAHFVSMRDQRVQQEKVDEWSATFQGKTAMGLQATLYGQQALALDSTGTLAALGLKKAVIQVFSEQD